MQTIQEAYTDQISHPICFVSGTFFCIISLAIQPSYYLPKTPRFRAMVGNPDM